MDKNNNVTEKKFTEEQVMNAIMQMDSEQRKMLFANTFDTVMKIANNQEYANQCLVYFYANAYAYRHSYETIKAFIEQLNSQDNKTPSAIDNLAELYKGLSREDRLEFSKKISEESNLENSLDMFKFQWDKLLNTLGIKK